MGPAVEVGERFPATADVVFVGTAELEVEEVVPRFLPYTSHSRLSRLTP